MIVNSFACHTQMPLFNVEYEYHVEWYSISETTQDRYIVTT